MYKCIGKGTLGQHASTEVDQNLGCAPKCRRAAPVALLPVWQTIPPTGCSSALSTFPMPVITISSHNYCIQARPLYRPFLTQTYTKPPSVWRTQNFFKFVCWHGCSMRAFLPQCMIHYNAHPMSSAHTPAAGAHGKRCTVCPCCTHSDMAQLHKQQVIATLARTRILLLKPSHSAP